MEANDMARKNNRRKYSAAAGRKVARAMHEMKRGRLRSGRSGRIVRRREQAIAIGLSQARAMSDESQAAPE